MSIGLAIVVKDEEDLIGEWLAFHAVAGVDRFLVYDNGSTDRTAEVVREAARELDVRLIPWPIMDRTFQDRAYHDAVTGPGADLEWLGFIDADEFLTPAAGLSLADVLDPLAGAGAVAVNWMVYGSGDHQTRPAGTVAESYTYRAFDDFGPNRHTKTLIRPSTYGGVRNCHMVSSTGVFVDVLGGAVRWLSDGMTESVVGVDRLRLNHYFTRSRACWAKKMDRGYRDLVRGEEDFFVYDRNEVHDEAAVHIGEEARRRFEFLRAPAPGPLPTPAGTVPIDFDAEAYLRLNPDVALAGYPAVEHYLLHGRAEGRSYRDPLEVAA